MPQNYVVLIVDLCLLLFGVAYNAAIAWAERKAIKSTGLWQFVDGTTSLQVALGAFVTLLGIAVIDYFVNVEGWSFWIAMSAFTASGIPMIYGSLRRYSKHLSEFFWRRTQERNK